MTFRQGLAMGAHVRRGEHGTPIVFAGPRLVHRQDDDGHETLTAVGSMLKSYTVFNLDQFEGFDPVQESAPAAFESIADADDFIARIGARVVYGGDGAFYSPASDTITVPIAQAFETPGAWYATLMHEHAHWTGADHRLARTFGKRFGDDAYAAEELVAELTAAFLTADFGIPGTLQHPEYLAHWAGALRNHKSALWTAASAATAAAGYLHTLADAAQPRGCMTGRCVRRRV